MKKLLLSLTVVLIATISLVAVTNHYNNYQKEQSRQAQARAEVSAQATEAALQPFKDRISELKGMYNTQVAECQKGEAAYAKLSQTVKSDTPSPVCGATLE